MPVNVAGALLPAGARVRLHEYCSESSEPPGYDVLLASSVTVDRSNVEIVGPALAIGMGASRTTIVTRSPADRSELSVTNNRTTYVPFTVGMNEKVPWPLLTGPPI